MTSLGVLDSNQVVFPELGFDFEISDTLFTVFGVEIKWYGFLIAIGMLIAMIYAFKNMKSYGIDPDRAIDVVIGGVLGGLVGARAYYVIFNWSHYSGDWLSIFNIRNGGLGIYGGIIGALLVGAIVAKIKKVKLMPLLDLVGIGFLVGQGIGRWGNFTNQEAFGCNTTSLFGMSSGKIQSWIVNHGSSATLADGQTLDPTIPVHPCFLYESVWCLVGFVLLVIFAKKIRKFDGQIFLTYAAWYGLGRFFIEGLRTDSLMIGSIRVSQLVAAVCVIASVILLVTISLKVKRMGTDYQLYKDTDESKMLIAESEQKQAKKDKKYFEKKYGKENEKQAEGKSDEAPTDENNENENENQEEK